MNLYFKKLNFPSVCANLARVEILTPSAYIYSHSEYVHIGLYGIFQLILGRSARICDHVRPRHACQPSSDGDVDYLCS